MMLRRETPIVRYSRARLGDARRLIYITEDYQLLTVLVEAARRRTRDDYANVVCGTRWAQQWEENVYRRRARQQGYRGVVPQHGGQGLQL